MTRQKEWTNSNLKFLREKYNITQKELAKRLKIDQSTIAKWENKSRKISLNWILNIANFFNVTLDDYVCTDLTKK